MTNLIKNPLCHYFFLLTFLKKDWNSFAMGPPNQRISNRSYELEILNMTRIFKLFLLDALLKLCMLRLIHAFQKRNIFITLMIIFLKKPSSFCIAINSYYFFFLLQLFRGPKYTSCGHGFTSENFVAFARRFESWGFK